MPHNYHTKVLAVVLIIAAQLFAVTEGAAGEQHTSIQSEVRWDILLQTTWEGYKHNYIFCGENCGNNLGLVFDPHANYHAVSEGVGYGLLMAVMMDDQPTFNVVYDAAQRILRDPNTGLFHWRADNQGNITGSGSATDADQDIAAALIFAQHRADRGNWEQHAQLPYGDRARSLIQAIWAHAVVDGRYLKPGNRFDGDGQAVTNPSYFSPAWYRIFDVFLATDQWAGVIEQGYQTLYGTEGSALGLAPDRSTAGGSPAEGYCEALAQGRADCGYGMTYDAIRVSWRIALDCLWFHEPRACNWNRRGTDFLMSLPQDQRALMYDMVGTPTVTYQDEAMLGMWLTAALAANEEDVLASLLDTFQREYTNNVAYNKHWGQTPQYYYNQSLAWFGISLVTGDFRNLAQ